MTYVTCYRGDGEGHPWQRIADDAEALRTFISHIAHEFPVRDAWVVVATGDGQQLTAFSEEKRANDFAMGESLDRDPAYIGVAFNDLPRDGVRVQVSRVDWPQGCKRATVLSFLNDHLADDFILAIPPVPFVAYQCPEFREWGIGGPDNVEDGYAGTLELDGPTQEGGW